MEGVDSLYTAEASAQETPQQDAGYQMATIGTVESDGVTLIFDGEESPSEKHYKVNAGAQLAAGQRVLVQAVAGSYVVLCAVGAPSSGGSGIPAGGTDGQLLAKDGATDYKLKWVDSPGQHVPSGGTDGQVLLKDGATNYKLKWGDAPKNYIPSGGTDGQLLAKNGRTEYSLKWTDAAKNYIPTGGSNGQMLVKSGATDYALKWADAPSNPLPTGGTNGQVLTKNGSTDYSVKWATLSPTVAALTSGNNKLTLSTKTLTPSATGFAIGTSSYQVELHSNSVRLYYSSYKYCTLTCTSAGKLAVNGTAIN